MDSNKKCLCIKNPKIVLRILDIIIQLFFLIILYINFYDLCFLPSKNIFNIDIFNTGNINAAGEYVQYVTLAAFIVLQSLILWLYLITTSLINIFFCLFKKYKFPKVRFLALIFYILGFLLFFLFAFLGSIIGIYNNLSPLNNDKALFLINFFFYIFVFLIPFTFLIISIFELKEEPY